MYISDFKYYKPGNLAEASKILQESEIGVILAGGTDLLVEVKKGMRKVTDIISLAGIEKLNRISEDVDFLYIGARVTHSEISNSKLINEKFPSIAEAASKIGSHQVRNVATIGGNLCTGASCSDSAPILMAYDAQIELVSSNNTRTIPLRDFFIFHHVTKIEKDEIMTRIIIPKTKFKTGSYYEKFGLREAASISVASSAVVISFDEDVCNNICIVIGACAPVPVVSENANNIILNKSIKELTGDPEVMESVYQAASNSTFPIDDIRGSAQYRRNLVKVLVKNALILAIQRIN